MGKKRGSAPEEEGEREPKKPKAMEVEFTGTHFKSLIKDPATALKGLEQFITLSRKLPSPTLYDVVEGYIKISIECTEILKLLDGERRPESEIMLIFQALEAILLRTASDLSHLNVAGLNIVKKMLNTYMKTIYACVYAETHRMCRICLNLLSAMVTQGSECARDVFSHFDFNNKFLPGLLKKRDKQGRPDVRMAYIQFALSFLISGDNATIVQILELKDFFGEIFSTGIKEDRISTINLLLSLLETKVVHNKAITKTQKVRFFTSVILNHIASLYRWSGIVDVRSEDAKNKDPKEAGKAMIRELVHSFLMDLCCSLKHGINFYDPSLGTAGRAGNLVLLRFLVGLKTATEDELLCDLVVNILKVCPDLLSRYFKETQYSFVPRLKSVWLDNIKLLKKIYDAQPTISAAFRTPEFVPIPRLLQMTMITTVAPVCNKSMFTQGLNLPHKIVKHTILSLVSSILIRAERNIDHCLRDDIWQKSEIYTPAIMSDFAQKYREAISKILPDMNAIVATWQSLLKQENSETKPGKGDETATPEEKDALASFQVAFGKKDNQDDDVQTTLLKASLLQVLCLYQRVVPHLVAQSTFDFSKLLKGIVNEKGIREEVPPILQHQILQVALELPASKFSWFKFQDVPDVGGEKSVFYLLLKMFATCNKPQLKTSTRLLIIKVLRDSGVFEYTWKELDLWLKNLDKVSEQSKEAVIQFLEQILIRLVSNPYAYTDKAADLVQEANMLHVSSGKLDAETASIPISHIDDVLDMVDVIVEGSEGLDEEVGVALDEDLVLQTFPFSAVVPVALESRNSALNQHKDGHDCVVQYLVSVLTDILHSQRDPLALCLLLQLYDKELKTLDTSSPVYSLLGDFNAYYSLWIPSRETLFPELDDSMIEVGLQDEASYSSLLKKTFVSSSILESDAGKLRDASSQLTLEELPLAVRHTLLCLKSTVDNFSKFKKLTGASLVGLFLDLLHSLLCTYEAAKVAPKQKSEETEKESELFLENNSISSMEAPESAILEDILTVIFRHPILEIWFLAMERQSLPPHILNPPSVKCLSSHLNKGVIPLLRFSAPQLQGIKNIHLLSKYFDAITESILKELVQGTKTSNKMSQPLEALQSLHPFLDTDQLNKITLAILRLPEEQLIGAKTTNDPTSDTQLSFYGKVLVQLLMEGHQRKQHQTDLASSVEHVKGVGSLLSTSSGGELETVLYEALRKDPVFAHVVGVDTLTYCLNQKSQTCLSIAALLIQHSRTHLLHFELWCNSAMEKKLRKNMDAYIPLINVYMNCRSHFQFTRPSKVSSSALLTLKEALWSKLVTVALSTEESEDSSEHVSVLSKLIAGSDVEELETLFDQLPGVLAVSYSQEKWNLADSLSQAADCSGTYTLSWKRALLAACMRCLTATYSANKESVEATQEAEKAMLLRLKELMPFVKEDIPTEWNSLVKTGLKYRYKDCAFLDMLHAGIGLWYGSDSILEKDLVQLSMVHMMITQHSLFLPTLLRSREEEENVDSAGREMIVDLLRSVVVKCPSVCDGNHFAVLLGAYGASLSSTDQKILQLLQAYENNNISLTDFRLLLWGPAAGEHHKTRKSLGKSLWQQPSMEEILSLLDREKMMKSVLHFPQHRKLVSVAGQENLFEDPKIKDLDELYDPCFLLPLFSELIRPELVVDCLKFVDVNGLGFTMAALSSYDYNMRAAANYILGAFLSHMEGERFRDKKQLQNLMDVVRNGIRQPNLRLTFSLTLYVAKAAPQILKPEEHMYIKMSKFLLSHQFLDMKKVPDFYKLFYSFDLEHKVEREWILGLLGEGLRDRYCYELYDYQRIFLVILAFYNSPLCDEASQNLILEVLKNASHVTKAAYQLIRDHSLLTWILNILEKRYLENKLLSNLVSLVHNLWVTNLGKKEKDLSGEAEQKEGGGEKKKLLPLDLVNEFFIVLMALLRHIRTNLDFSQVTQFFTTMSSVVRYRSLVLGAFKEMGRFAVNERIISSKDVLLLLHKWSTIEKDLELQESLSNLAQKHKVKELLSTIKEKYRPQASRHLRKRIEAEDQEELKQQEIPDLDASRDLVKSILIHWEPRFSNTIEKCEPEETMHIDCKPKLNMEETETEVNIEDSETKDGSSDTNQLAHATACLVAKWILKAEVEHPFNTQNIYKSVQWFNASIVPHVPVVQELLKDCMLRSTIFRLYSTVCNATEMKTSSLELLHLFNTVMLQLIEAQSLNKHPFYDAVKALCLCRDNKADDIRKAAGDFLMSLYVGDVWLGAEEPVTFRHHVEAISESAVFPSTNQKTPTRKRKEAQEVIVCLCKELSSVGLRS
ncbi:nucleolar pre-ribosomal-associated protein 1 [Discoglossus pictus]